MPAELHGAATAFESRDNAALEEEEEEDDDDDDERSKRRVFPLENEKYLEKTTRGTRDVRFPWTRCFVLLNGQMRVLICATPQAK